MGNFRADELFSLRNKSIFLTGAAGALGTQYAHAIAANDGNLILLDVDESQLKSLASHLRDRYEGRANPLKISYAACDLRDRKHSDEVVKGLLERNDPVDVLINNAALTGRTMKNLSDASDVLNCDEQVWDACLEVNLTEVFLMTKRVLGSMIVRRSGNIINVSSIYGNVGPDFSLYGGTLKPCPLPYAVTKAAILNFTRYVANQYGSYGIRCNSLTPGGVESDLTAPDFVNRYSARTALGRMAKEWDYVGALLYLSSDASSYMTGANLVVDGGWTAR